MKRIFCFSIAILLIFQSLGYAALEISTDKTAISFDLMHLGEEKEVTQYGDYHQEVTCESTNGNTWYLKISLLNPLTSDKDSIPLECFKWQLVSTSGNGTPPNLYQYKEFSLFPELVYISAPDENNDSLISFKFKYYLKIPEIQTRGGYNTVIRFTLTEVL